MRLLLTIVIFFVIAFSFSSAAQEGGEKLPDTVIKTIYTTYYAKKFEGRKTSSGEIYRSFKLTAAHRRLPLGTMVKVTNLHNGQSVEVRINDRGPFSKKFELDISQAAAKAIGIYRLGYARVEIRYVDKSGG